MNAAELRSNLHNLIDTINDSKTLKAVYALIAKRTKQEADWWDELPDEVKADIEEGLKELDAGLGIPHDEVMKEIKSRYKI